MSERRGWFDRLTSGLRRSSGALTGEIKELFTHRKLDDEALEALEEILIGADLGVSTAARMTASIAKSRYDKEITEADLRAALAEEIARVLEPVARPLAIEAGRRPFVVLVVGVNGTGKTTTIGKLAKRFADEGRSVVLCAGDTFRAAAIEQLGIWAQRAGAGFVAGEPGADAAGLVYDALKQARESGTDLLLIDTAGRLHNKADLMAELEKIGRVLGKLDESAPHAVLLVLDATTGQNAIRQVEVFREVCNVTGLVMTKLDGTARGGVLVAVADRFKLPVHAIGVGEGVDDLHPFRADEFARALCGLAD